ncbi:MAG TPA: 6-phosphofructokinase [Anaerolineales bacterium]|nr:6-phosphofructokinase [Anaerolineales bacterium]
MTKRVAILTGGGDVPGLNMCLKSLVYRVIDLGFEPIGVRKGWDGLIHYNPRDPSTYSEYFIELTKNMVRPVDRTPGSFLHSSRFDPREFPGQLVPEFLRDRSADAQDLTKHIIDVIERLGYRAIIVIGDDDMLHYAAYLSQQGVPVIAIPKTIHNNILGTDYTLGFSTGLARGVSFVHELRALAGSREQIIVVETFAAKSGYSTLLMGWLSGADRVIIPEVPYDPERLASLILQDKHQTPANYAVVMICDGSQIEQEKIGKYAQFLSSSNGKEFLSAATAKEGISNEQSLVGSGLVAARLLGHVTGEEVFLQQLTYLLRTGSPDGQDLLGAANFALTAARLLREDRFGRMAAFVQNKMWTDVELGLAIEGVKTVDVGAWYDKDNYRPQLSLIWSVEGV